MQEKREQILNEALKMVPFDGWSGQTLACAAKSIGLDAKYARIAFPGGATEAVDMFLRQLDEQMLKKIEKKKTDLSIRKTIILAIRTRLELAEKYKNVIRKTVAFYAMPQNSLDSVKSIWHTADSIWYAAGDKSTDFNHYTKRATLSGVYSTTLLYWLSDRSKDHKDTWEFLDRRIENVMQFEKCKSSVKGLFDKLMPSMQG